MALSQKFSTALLLYTTILWISQVTYDVSANELAEVQNTVPGSAESNEQTAAGDLDSSYIRTQDSTSSTGDSLGYYQKYKQFVNKHNKTFTIVLGVLSAIFLVGVIIAIAFYCFQENGKDGANYVSIVIIPIVFWLALFGYMVYKLYGSEILAYFKSKKAPVVKSTVDTSG
ncbi:putative integral membrane protein [Babesia bovis T2Bo]|uniref:Uncharacterized protein n=1 Tax=Babesia bovis TaxID=5865 RepID=A7ASP4_BABBO|nr:putative integral membrane protein [Babesia bovis T2Bo]EDO07563.1 putative integral membrane protein [Babesia bovis T2Bo]|eukprot:XP_001611131.1 hypothetical protein [Babesia bovis T2Bo]